MLRERVSPRPDFQVHKETAVARAVTSAGQSLRPTAQSGESRGQLTSDENCGRQRGTVFRISGRAK